MEEELLLQQPTDRRLGSNVNTLPPGPPGAEFDADEFDTKPPPEPKNSEKESSVSKTTRRSSPSGSPPTASKRKSSPPPRHRRSPSPINRRRRSPSPRRGRRYRDYSPDRRRYDRPRRSPDRRRGGRDRSYRNFRDSRSRSRSLSPRRSGGGGGIAGIGGNSRWSPKNKPASPLPAPINAAPPPPVGQVSQAPPGPAQYGVMSQPMYRTGDSYGNAPYNQYGMPPPPQSGFPPQTDAYGMPAPGAPNFNTAYPPPTAWGVNDSYGQQSWMQQPVPDPSQMQQMQPPPPIATAAPSAAMQQPQTVAPPVVAQSLNVLSDAAPGTIESKPTHDAVAQEAENQRDELKKQRTSYLKKTAVLKKELKMLKEQRKDLRSGVAPPSPTTKGFIDENEKLQSQIQKKLSTIENVIDMLTGIIGEENLEHDDDDADDDDGDDIGKTAVSMEIGASKKDLGVAVQRIGNNSNKRESVGIADRDHKKVMTTGASAAIAHTRSTSESSTGGSSSSSSSSSSNSSSSSENEQDPDDNDDDDSSPERLKTKAMESMMKSKQRDTSNRRMGDALLSNKSKDEEKLAEEKKRFNYVFYDPEMHWCQTCDIFPKTAKDYLNHLHTKDHIDRESIETPWHMDMVNDQYPTYDNAPTKRTPIRGLTFFVPATAWFCKLCTVWMGDLHCASTHLKSQLHSNKYNTFLEKNPHFEVNWLADRQRVLNEKNATPLPPQITSVSTTAADRSNGSSKKSKKDDDKSSKKRKRKSSDKKDKKKKKKRSKKRKKANIASSSSSSSSDSSTSDSEEQRKQKIQNIVIKDLDNPNPAASIRVAMRKQENSKLDDDVPPPPPPMALQQPPSIGITPGGNMAVSGRIGKWTVAQEGIKSLNKGNTLAGFEEDNKRDDAIIQQWNSVQPVISEKEKKLLEELKGKLKNKPREEDSMTTTHASSSSSAAAAAGATTSSSSTSRLRSDNSRRDFDSSTDRRRRSRSPAYGGRRDYNRRGRRSRSHGRYSPPPGWRNRRRSRSLRRRSRTRDRSPDRFRNRRRSRNRSRDRSRDRSRERSSRERSPSRSRVEKPVIKHSEFRPRVPEREKEKEKKLSDSKDKKDVQKKPKSSASTAIASGKKLPFIGKMPVFKKQNSVQPDGVTDGKRSENENGAAYSVSNEAPTTIAGFTAANAMQLQQQRLPPPTAAQIQMAMMEDVYGNAPPFHPDAGMMVDYDDLMPDPVQFVNLMGQAPPPPPPPPLVSGSEDAAADDSDILPPGIDEMETEEFVPKPISDKSALPKDLEEALNIIFPGEKKPGADESEIEKKQSSGETQIIIEEPVMQADDLVKQGIHMVTIEETSMICMDEASQLSMNEPLVFNKLHVTATTVDDGDSASPATVVRLEDASSQNAADIELSPVQAPPPMPATNKNDSEIYYTKIDLREEIAIEEPISITMVPAPVDIPMPVDTPATIDTTTTIEMTNEAKEDLTTAVVYDLDDIPEPPPAPASPTESEKNRRQEELDDLAMLGIDADDMAAQCI